MDLDVKTSNSLLNFSSRRDYSLPLLRSEELKKIGRFWVGKEVSKLKKADVEKILNRTYNTDNAVQKVFNQLSDEQLSILAIYKRYGGSLPGWLLHFELIERGIKKKLTEKEEYSNFNRDDPVRQLSEKLILVGRGYRSYVYQKEYYPHYHALPKILELCDHAKPIKWNPRSAVATEQPEQLLSYFSHLGLALSGCFQELEAFGGIKLNQGGLLSKGSKNRLAKRLSCFANERLPIPDLESFLFELLKELKIVSDDELVLSTNAKRAETFFKKSSYMQSRDLISAWLKVSLWQDGIGGVPDRNHSQDTVRIAPVELFKAKTFLMWVLELLAEGTDKWFDLEKFLELVYSRFGDTGVDFYFGSYAWTPSFESAKNKNKLNGERRRLGYWMDDEGVWFSNVVMVSLVRLGFTERGVYRCGNKKRLCFRISDMGRNVLTGKFSQVSLIQKFLVVQANYEITVYLDKAENSALWQLTRFTEVPPVTSEVVQTFKLSRDSVYQSLEEGFGVEKLLKFLEKYSQNVLPENIKTTVLSWSQKRDSLVLRSNVGLKLTVLDESRNDISIAFLKSEKVSKARNEKTKGLLEENGRVTFRCDPGIIILARLNRFAKKIENSSLCYWQISCESIREAKKLGIKEDQIISWLHEISGTVPPILEMSIQNWLSKRLFAYSGKLTMMSFDDQKTLRAIATSETLKPHIHSIVGDQWIILNEGSKRVMSNHLKNFGFSFHDDLSQIKSQETDNS